MSDAAVLNTLKELVKVMKSIDRNLKGINKALNDDLIQSFDGESILFEDAEEIMRGK